MVSLGLGQTVVKL